MIYPDTPGAITFKFAELGANGADMIYSGRPALLHALKILKIWFEFKLDSSMGFGSPVMCKLFLATG